MPRGGVRPRPKNFSVIIVLSNKHRATKRKLAEAKQEAAASRRLHFGSLQPSRIDEQDSKCVLHCIATFVDLVFDVHAIVTFS